MPEPETCNCAALREAARHVSKMYDDTLAPARPGPPQYSILARLDRLSPCGIRDLARSLVMDRSTLGRLLRPLEKRSLVKIEVSKDDRRGRVLQLTRSGHALLAKARPLWAEAQRRYVDGFGDSPAAELRAILKQVTATDFSHAGKSRPIVSP